MLLVLNIHSRLFSRTKILASRQSNSSYETLATSYVPLLVRIAFFHLGLGLESKTSSALPSVHFSLEFSLPPDESIPSLATYHVHGLRESILLKCRLIYDATLFHETFSKIYHIILILQKWHLYALT